MAVLTLLVGLVVIWTIARSLWGGVLAALDNVQQGARRLAAGDWEHLVTTGGPTELAELGASFNAMSTRLLENHAELEHHAWHDGLTALGNRALMVYRVERSSATRGSRVGVDALVEGLAGLRDVELVAKRLVTAVSAPILSDAVDPHGGSSMTRCAASSRSVWLSRPT